jgi:chromosome partitioning protein
LGFFTVNGLAACDEVLIPLQCEPRAFRGVIMLLKTIENVKKAYNSKIKLLGVVATMVNRNTNISVSIMEQARKTFEKYKINMFNSVIYRTVRFSEADYYNVPAVSYSNNEAIQGYRDLVKEVFNIG